MAVDPSQLDAWGKSIVDSAYKVHVGLGPGLLESAYEACLLKELRKHGLKCESQVNLPVFYDGEQIDLGYRLDILVQGSIILELKAIEKILPIHEAQIISYLKLSNFRLGYLINFNVVRIKDGIKRFANDFKE